MKKTILLILVLMPGLFVFTQEQDSHKGFRTGIRADGGWNLPVRLTTKYITEETSPWYGYGSWSGSAGFSFMVHENYRLLLAGSLSEHKIGFELSPPIYTIKKVYTETFRLISIPVTLRRYLKNSYYVDAGTIIDFPYRGKPEWIDDQTGFGLTLGAGKEIRLKRIILEVAPGMELHSVIPFAEERYHQRLFVAALRLGVSYIFGQAGIIENGNGTLIPEGIPDN